MTKRLAVILALTCATLHAQSVIVKGTGADAVRGMTIAAIPETVLTNLVVTGSLTPNVTGTYSQVSNNDGKSRWFNSGNGYYVYYYAGANNHFIGTSGTVYSEGPYWAGTDATPIGDYTTVVNGAVGTATVTYSIVTNNAVPASVTVRGKATP